MEVDDKLSVLLFTLLLQYKSDLLHPDISADGKGRRIELIDRGISGLEKALDTTMEKALETLRNNL